MHLNTSVFLGLTLGAVVFVGSFAGGQQSSGPSSGQSSAQSTSVQSTEMGRKVVSHMAPQYPDLARRMQISGTVKLEATVAPNGRVKSTRVIGGSPVLMKAALDALQSWKWESTSSESKEMVELTFRPD